MIVIKRNSHMNHKFPAQCGYAIFGIIAVLGVATTAIVVTSLSTTAVHNEQNRKTSSSLALAKQALIASAASSATRPGSLPCPDINNDGQPDLTQAGTCTAMVGRLPWQSLGLPDLRDAAGERLWYAMSENFQDISANRINPTSEGRLNAIGVTSTHGVVAIVFAPGPAVGNQGRDAPNANIAESYIESYSSDTRTVTLRAPDSTYNDQILMISPVDIFAMVEWRVAKEVQNALLTYFTATSGKLPWYAPACSGSGTVSCPAVNPPPALPSPGAALPANGTFGYIPTNDSNLNAILPNWFSANNWNSVMTYRLDSDCAAGLVTCGTAFAGHTVGGSRNVLIGFIGDTANTKTKALVGFAGVSPLYNNYQTTQLSVAIQ